MLILLSLVTFISIYEFSLLKENKKQLKRSEEIRKKLYETSDKISKINDEGDIYSIVLDTIIELIPNATNGSVLLYNHKDESFNFKVVNGFNNELKNLRIKKEESYLYSINGFKETAIINNPKEFDKANAHKSTIEQLQNIQALEINCTLSAPIYIDGKFIGLINIDSDIQGHVFTQKDLDLMNQIKCELELALKNALAQNRLKYLASFDELTGLINRRELKREFNKELENIKLTKQQFCMVMIDLDGFKYINDTYGHYYGDIMLKHFSGLLKKFVDESDIVSRFAGDEFVIIFKEKNLVKTQQKMNSIMESILAEEVNGISLEFSYGICEVNCYDNTNFDKTLALADVKMYEDKRVKI